MIKKLCHIGVNVRDIEKAKNLFTTVFNLDFPLTPSKKASFSWMGDVLIEIWEPQTDEAIKALERRGEGINHLCFEVDNIEEEVKTYVEKGLKLKTKGIVHPPGRRVAFFGPEDTLGILIELVEFDEDRTGSPY